VSELELHRCIAWGVIAAGIASFVILQFVSAPYGRHARSGWGPTLPARLSWVLMEAPAVVLWGAIYALGEHRLEAAPLALLGLWQLHYVNRAFVYPLRTRGADRPMPVLVALLAFVFQIANAYVNARQVSQLGAYGAAWLLDPRFLLGGGLFVLGFGINQWADGVLRGLRRPGETGYRIPRGGLYERVSCPNYLGEILTWIGWAVATWSLAGVSFAVFTITNLAPRAATNHRWYQDTFPDYPKERRRLVPFLW
jgi:protein-S-isoprenylcysteine O-methyltransferase Ste14